MVDDFQKEIDSFLARSGLSKTAFGEAAANDGHLYSRIERGGISLKVAEKIKKYISDWEPA